MSFDLDGALRWLKPHRRVRALRRRNDDELSWVAQAGPIGAPVLLDTSVYIDTLQGRSPAALDALITLRTCTHSSVCLSELTHAFGRLDPLDPRTAGFLGSIRQAIADMPAQRTVAPDAGTWGTAGILAGILLRLGSHPPGAERRCLNDVLIYLQGRKLGLPVVSGNVADFDFLNQLVPDGQILLYRTE